MTNSTLIIGSIIITAKLPKYRLKYLKIENIGHLDVLYTSNVTLNNLRLKILSILCAIFLDIVLPCELPRGRAKSSSTVAKRALYFYIHRRGLVECVYMD